jgi:hypothetical protein
MIVVFANNQTMVAPPATTVTITTDPVPLRGSDRINAIVTIHTIFNTGGVGLAWGLEVSNDGVVWLTFGSGGDAAATGSETWVNTGVAWAFVRVTFSLTGGASIAGATFDMHAHFDKQGG